MPVPSPKKKPLAPRDAECCESGSCSPCVWDNYYAELKVWRLEQVKINDQAVKKSQDTGNNE
jgi:hypothetical protein